MLNKTLFAASLAVSAFFWGCSGDDPSETITTPIVVPEDPVSSDSPAPASSETGAIEVSSATDLPISSSTTTPETQVSSSSAVPPASSTTTPAVTSSSSSKTRESSSSKEIKNSTPKETFLPKAGFYSNLTLNPVTGSHGGEVRCTFDGSKPTQGSEQLNQAKQISQNTAVRCLEFLNGNAVDSTTQTYFINENVQMPVVAITVNQYDMFDQANGYYSTGNVGYCEEPCYQANYWKDIELPVHVEFFENGNSSQGKNWEIDAGLSIMGRWSRYNEKKSVAISMRQQYEDGRLRYPIFKTRPNDKKFKSFNLRNNGNRFHGDFIEDAALSSILEGSGVDYQRSRQVVVFYNGIYYGIHDMRERLNEHFVETNYGIDSKSVDMIKHTKDSIKVTGGSDEAYRTLLNKINSGSFAGENNAAYEEIKGLMDVGNFADYMASEIYFHNGDWPDNNVRAWRAPDQPFKFAVFDLDHGFGWDWAVAGFDYYSENMFGWIKRGGLNGCNTANCFAQIYIKLIQNPDFKRLFINHSAVMLNSFLTVERVSSAVTEMTASIPSNEMQRDLARFERKHVFDQSGQTLVEYARSRGDIVRGEYRQEFGLSEDVTVGISANGSGRVLLDGMQLPSKSYQGKFFGGNAMLLTAVPENGAVFNAWEDGSTENPRLVTPNGGANYSANFK